ncbi:MAG: DNA (cytosine-5-)-methyltransferase [Bacteroidota bacterium]
MQKTSNTYEQDWNFRAKQLLKAELSKRNINNRQLAKQLNAVGIAETKSSIDSKISRGTFSASFLLQCLQVIGCESFPAELTTDVRDVEAKYELRKDKIRFIDLFAGIGGFRLGLEKAFEQAGIATECVLTSEIKAHAVKTLRKNFTHQQLAGDITKLPSEYIPDFDILLGGFPCQPFSSGGKRFGFVDTRGTLFFEIERILEAKQPSGFILENVEGLVKHDLEHKNDQIGRTLSTILTKLQNLGYKVSWQVLDAVNFGLPQSRRRIFIVGTKTEAIPLTGFQQQKNQLSSILESGKPTMNTSFTKKLLSQYPIQELYGKSIKDKRGGSNNIHSWDIGIKGKINDPQKRLLNQLFKERRKKKWSKEIGIDWMDGIPLTLKQIQTFFEHDDLKGLLDDLVQKGYLKFEHPKKLVVEQGINGQKKYRTPDEKLPKGYNIVTGKLSFEINKILDPADIAPTLVATDVSRIAVPDGEGLRRLSIREGLRLFGYPEWFELLVKEKEAFDLLGNTIPVTVVQAVAARLAQVYQLSTNSLLPV